MDNQKPVDELRSVSIRQRFVTGLASKATSNVKNCPKGSLFAYGKVGYAWICGRRARHG
ncbi:hypothetical protein RE6C_05560 [Rhodopirellula europaea 6C]|uniref:Uncharacterized protein n=1 Tax=Rhodopirellula europaea 6C TaxID=1263867 RepID=M2ALX5_9BACT|nr:hypothetical protein RE6C_05560 [Rhodopirellula europaea 6C]